MSKVLTDGMPSLIGGVNQSFAEDTLQKNELWSVRNARGHRYHSLQKRPGSQRLHAAAASAAFKGVVHWDSPLGAQIVGSTGGQLQHQLVGSTVTAFAGAGISTSHRTRFAEYRVAGVPRLYGVDGNLMFSFDGATLNVVTDAPSGLDDLVVYKGRGFGLKNETLEYTAPDTLEDWSILNGGGSYPIDTYDNEPLVAGAVAGDSLLLAKEDSVSRYTGYSRDTVTIGTNTDGVSSSVGVIAQATFIPIEDGVVFGVSDLGPYFFTESAAREIGMKVEPAFDFEDRDTWVDSFAVHNRRRKEIWLFLPGGIWWAYNYRTQSWSGPWDYQGFEPCAAARLERSSGRESVVVAGEDGILRDGDVDDVGARDDVLVDGTGGNPVPMVLTPRDLTFGDALRLKHGHVELLVLADLGPGGELIATWNADGRTKTTRMTTKGSGIKPYVSGATLSFHRLSLTLADYTSEVVRVNAFNLEAEEGRRA